MRMSAEQVMWHDMLDRLCAESDRWDEEFQSPDLPPPGAGLGVFMWISGQGKWHCRACVEITGNKHVASQEHKMKMRVFCSPPCGKRVSMQAASPTWPATMPAGVQDVAQIDGETSLQTAWPAEPEAEAPQWPWAAAASVSAHNTAAVPAAAEPTSAARVATAAAPTAAPALTAEELSRCTGEMINRARQEARA